MSGHVLVFTPAPQLTVTVEQPAQDDGAAELHLHAGGQGVWQGRMIVSLGVPVALCAALGGEVGRLLEVLIADEGMTLHRVDRQASSGWYLHDRRGGERREIAEQPGPPLTRHEIDELYSLTLTEGLRAAVTVLSGPAHPDVVPPDMYRRLAADLTGTGGTVVADLSGENLAAVLAGGVRLLKVSHEELTASGHRPDLVAALHKLRADGAEAVVISRAGDPALALLDDDQVYEVEVPQLEAADHRGAGDSMTAGAAAVLATGGDLATAVRTGAAAGALNVTRHGLGTGRADAVAELVKRVRLVPVRS